MAAILRHASTRVAAQCLSSNFNTISDRAISKPKSTQYGSGGPMEENRCPILDLCATLSAGMAGLHVSWCLQARSADRETMPFPDLFLSFPLKPDPGLGR